jgi:hypothetical protein
LYQPGFKQEEPDFRTAEGRHDDHGPGGS